MLSVLVNIDNGCQQELSMIYTLQPEQWNKSSQREIVKYYEFGVSSQEIAFNIYIYIYIYR